MQSEVVRRMRDRLSKKPWHYRMRIKLKVKWWFFLMDIRHYWNWCTSKEYRKSYGDCTFWDEFCYKDERLEKDAYCKNNPKCVLKKSGIFYIDA